MKLVGTLFALILIVRVNPAFAQFDSIAENYNNLAVSNTDIAIRSAMNNNVMQSFARRPTTDRSNRSFAPQSITGGTGNSQIDPTVLRYTASIPRRRSNLTEFVNRLRSADPQGAAALEKLLASRDLVAEVGQGITHYGLRADNVADAYAVWWTQSWQAAHGDTSDPSRAAMQAVKAQAVRGIGSTPVFTNATDAMKQEFAETLLLQAALTSSYVDTYKNDPAMMRKMGEAVRKGAKASGLDLDSMTLTENGFVPSGKTGAAAPEPGGHEQALAANAAPAPETPADHPPYILIAAAGGAGIGGVFLLGKALGRRG